MRESGGNGISQALDQLSDLSERETVRIGDIVEKLGVSSFASLMLVFTLVSASPASAIPGVTAMVGIIVAILVAQMIAGKKSVWLPQAILRRKIGGEKLRKGVEWLRPPVGFVERILRRRLTYVLHRPFLYIPLVLILCIALFMPVMEIVPTSGSIASTVIAFFAASLLMRDGVLALLSMALMLSVPLAVWHFGFSG